MGQRPAMMRTPPLDSSVFMLTGMAIGVRASESRRGDRGEIRRLRLALRGTGCASSTFVRIGDAVVTAPPTFERLSVSSTRMRDHLGMVPGCETCAAVEARGRRLMPGEEQRVNNSDCMKRMSEDRTVGVHV